MSEDLVINVNANTSQANAALNKTKEVVKGVGDEATSTGAKSKSAFDGMSRNILPVAAAYMGVRFAMRGVREVLQELNASSQDDSLISGKMKEAALVAADSVKNLGTAFDKFKQTAVAAITPVIGYIAEDLSGALDGATKKMGETNEAAKNGANGWAVLKTTISVLVDAFNILFQTIRTVMAVAMSSIGVLVKGFGYLASIVSKEVGDSMKDFGTVMIHSAQQIVQEAGGEYVKTGKSLGKALSGGMYEETMAGFDRYKAGITGKAKELQEQLNAQKKADEEKAKTEAAKTKFDPVAIAQAKNLAVVEQWRVKIAGECLLNAEDEYALRAKTIKQIEQQNAIIEAGKKSREAIEEVEKRAAEDRSAQIEADNFNMKQKREDAEQLVKIKLAEYDATQKTYNMEIQKSAELLQAKSGIKTKEPIRTTLDSRQLEELNVSSSGIDPEDKAAQIAKERMDASLKAEMESYEQSVQLANDHAERIIEIDRYLNGTIEQIEGKRRVQEIIAEKKNAQLKQMTWQEAANGISGALGNLATLMQSKNKTLFEIGRAAAIAQNVVDTITSAASSYAFGARLGGPVLGAAFAATAVVAGAVRASALLAAQPSGGNIGSLGGGYTDTSNVGGPGGSGAGVGASSQVNVSLYGERFGADQVRGLIDAINAETKDGKKVTVKV